VIEFIDFGLKAKGLAVIDIVGELHYNFQPMKIKVSYITVALLLILSLPAMAVEPAQALLAELTRPNAVPVKKEIQMDRILTELAGKPAAAGNTNVEIPSLQVDSSLVNGYPESVTELFTLDELKERADNSQEPGLPDEELPPADIPLALNDKVEYFINYFQTKAKPSFSKWLSRSTRYLPLMKEILKQEGMPEDLVYVAMIESGFNLRAQSWASAVGPWQFMSATGKRYSLKIDQWIDERKDPVKATTAAALYLKELYGMFNGDWYLAAAGYNAGENKIMRAIGMYNSSDFWEISRGSYLKRETKEYVPKLLAAAIIAKDPAKYGFADIAYLPPIEFETVKIPSRTDLELVAKLSGTTFDTIKDLNPDLRHWCTPPNYPDYELKLPKGTRQQFEVAYAKVPADQRYTEKTFYTRYQAKKKDTLKSVARRFGLSEGDLADLNGISRKSRIGGKTLVVPAKQTVDFSREGRTVTASIKNSSHNKYYTVKKGDTLESLSRQFKVSTKLLSTWNNMKGKLALKPGRRIIIARYIEKNGEMVPVRNSG
jgi:membrane-bound lytic murein transglycosylase D